MNSTLTGFIALIGIFIVVSFLLSYPLMMLWNSCLVPATTILNEVEWTQMWGITFLTSLLFKGYK